MAVPGRVPAVWPRQWQRLLCDHKETVDFVSALRHYVTRKRQSIIKTRCQLAAIRDLRQSPHHRMVAFPKRQSEFAIIGTA